MHHLLPALQAAPFARVICQRAYRSGHPARYADQGIEGFAVHPDGIMTSLQRHMSTEDIQARTGVMHYAVDAEVADQLWQVSLELLSDYF